MTLQYPTAGPVASEVVHGSCTVPLNPGPRGATAGMNEIWGTILRDIPKAPHYDPRTPSWWLC